MPQIDPQLLDAMRVLFARASEEDYATMVDGGWLSALDGFGSTSDSPLAPPCYEDYRHFINNVLTPGVPGALVPVESLYVDRDGHAAGIRQGQGFYLGPPAHDVEAICSRLEIEIPEHFKAMPDHLVLLLELSDFLCAHAPADQACSFGRAHFAWLAGYRSALRSRMASERDDRLVRVARFYDQVLGRIEAILLDGDENDMRDVAQSA